MNNIKNIKILLWLILLPASMVKHSHGIVPSDSELTALHIKANTGDLNGVIKLITDGDPVDPIDSEGRTPLFHAVYLNHRDIVEYLIQSGANINAADNHKRTVLYYAAQNGCAEIVEILLNNGADITLCMINGNTPAHIAYYNNHKNVIEVMQKFMAINRLYDRIIIFCHKCHRRIL